MCPCACEHTRSRLVHNQSTDGSWGKFGKGQEGVAGAEVLRSGFSASGDAQRSPRALSLLQWCYSNLEARSDTKAAITKYINFLLVGGGSAAFGVNELALPTGFVGLAVADLIHPWSTFTPVRA